LIFEKNEKRHEIKQLTMKPPILLLSLTLITLLPGCASEPQLPGYASEPQRQMTLLPGLTYYAGPEKLSGKFVFLYHQNNERSIDNNDDKSAALYEFDIAGERLSKLTDCPDG
jgi:hypothetical protein